MKKIALIVFVLVFVLGALAVGIFAGKKLQAPAPQPGLITFEKLGELVSLKVNVADIVEYTKPRKLGIPGTNLNIDIAGTKVVVIVKGDCLLTTDLTTAKYDAIDNKNRTATIILPPPIVKHARLNHEDSGTRIYAISKNGIEKIIPSGANLKEAVDEAMKLAQQKVDDASKNPEVIRDAKDNAERILKAMYSGVNWKVNIFWKS